MPGQRRMICDGKTCTKLPNFQPWGMGSYGVCVYSHIIYIYIFVYMYVYIYIYIIDTSHQVPSEPICFVGLYCFFLVASQTSPLHCPPTKKISTTATLNRSPRPHIWCQEKHIHRAFSLRFDRGGNFPDAQVQQISFQLD